MIAAGLTIDEYEKLPFNFTVPVSIQKYTFISQRPGEVSRMYLFTAPFQLNVSRQKKKKNFIEEG